MSLLVFGTSFVLSLLFVPILRKLSQKRGWVAKPREDRWHRSPIPITGGIGIFIAFIITLIISATLMGVLRDTRWGLLAGSTLVFLIGVYDDLKRITPPTKLLGQILAATIVILLGYTTNFFTPKISNEIVAQIPNIILTYVWLIGITNAINLLDNMDGLAGGISFITAMILSYFFWSIGDLSLLWVSLALAGSTLGFLLFNFPPASIFMGDSGSLFLGFTLAVLAIARQPQASNVFAVLGVPTLLFLLPILDTTLVTITRLLRGQSPTLGGRDHTSHRLVAFGLTERQAVVILYGIALISGFVGIAIETLDYWLSLVLVPILVLSLALVAAYLGRMKVVVSTGTARDSTFTKLIYELTYKRRLLEIILDFFLIGLAYYLAYWTLSGLTMSETNLVLFLRSLPIAYAGTFSSFFLFGIYRGVWRYLGVDDLIRYGAATIGGVAITGIIVYILNISSETLMGLLLLYGIFLYLGLAASRSSFKLLDQAYSQQVRKREERVLILGASDSGEMAYRWILINPQLGYRVVGFFDTDPLKIGRKIHGLVVYGGSDQMQGILAQQQIDGVILTSDTNVENEQIQLLCEACEENGCWVRKMRLEFELLKN